MLIGLTAIVQWFTNLVFFRTTPGELKNNNNQSSQATHFYSIIRTPDILMPWVPTPRDTDLIALGCGSRYQDFFLKLPGDSNVLKSLRTTDLVEEITADVG